MKNNFQMYFFAALLVGMIVLAFFIFLPFLVSLAMAATLAVVCHPLYERLRRLTGDRRGIAAAFTVLLAILAFLLPLAILGVLVFREAGALAEEIRSDNGAGLARLQDVVKDYGSRFSTGYSFNVNINEYLRQAANWLAQNLGAIFSGIAQVSLNIFVGLVALYYLLKDGKELTRTLVMLSPLPDGYDYEILSKLEGAVSSVVKGSLVVALVQGALAGIGMALFNLPNPALLGSFAAIAALIPGIGTALVLVPAIGFLFLTGAIGSGIGLLIWGAVAVGLSDNFLRPLLMKRGMQIHPFLILLSVFGGLSFFGATGFILGPLAMSLLFALIEIYRLLVDIDRKKLPAR
jgi:predicted PurR-regulated permease PerM